MFGDVLGAVQKPRDRGGSAEFSIWSLLVTKEGEGGPLQIECLTIIKEYENTGM